MKAAQISAYGGKEVMQTVTDAPKPQVGPGQVLIQVQAAAVNPFDWKVREGMVRQMAEVQFPAILGGDLSGIVAEVGPDVTGFAAGDEVYGQAGALSSQGSFAEFAPAAAASLAPKPKSVDFVTAAALPLAGVSAYQALVEHAGLKRDQRVLIHGGAGGIGSLAIQIARHLDAYVATTIDAKDADFVKQLGANEVIDYKTQSFETLLHEFDVVFDTVGGDTYTKSFQVLLPGGIIVSMVQPPNEELAKQYNVKAVNQYTQVTTERLTALAELVDSGALEVNIDRVFPLDEAAEALAYLQEGHPQGKVVIQVA